MSLLLDRISKNRKPVTSIELLKDHCEIDNNGCWLWQGKSISNGYALTKVKQKPWLAHRLSWSLKNGEIPNKLQVCHKCDVKLCCNPDHLFLGTQLDNIKDCINKNRKTNPPIMTRDIGGIAKVNSKQLKEMVSFRIKGAKLKELASIYNMNSAYVSRLCLQTIRKSTEDHYKSKES